MPSSEVAAGRDSAAGDVVTVRYFAGARTAAGLPEEQLPAGSSLAELLTSLSRRARLGPVLAVASFLVDGTPCHDHSRHLAAGAVVDVLPPFAGG